MRNLDLQYFLGYKCIKTDIVQGRLYRLTPVTTEYFQVLKFGKKPSF